MAYKNVKNETTYRTEVYGNVVREVAVPVPKKTESENRPVEVPKKRGNRKGQTLSIPYCMLIAAACVCIIMCGCNYLQLQALSTKYQKDIAEKESQLAEMKKENMDELNRIEASINLDEIREIATNELGMVYATEENVVLYENTMHNYVEQYDDVP